LDVLPLLQQHSQRCFTNVFLEHPRQLLPKRRGWRNVANRIIVVEVADRVLFEVCIEDRLAFAEYVVD
jgi:hypothetical protein